jgi:hypothetical protein
MLSLNFAAVGLRRGRGVAAESGMPVWLVAVLMLAVTPACGDDGDGGDSDGTTGGETGAATTPETADTDTGETGDTTDSSDTGDDIPVIPEEPASTAEPYTLTPFDQSVIASFDGEGVFFQRATETIALTGGPFEKVTLRVKLESPCFPFAKWRQSPPPQGQNWPAECDAFDRNFEFTLDEPQGEGEPPAVELVRAITPFGGPMAFNIDITDIANGIRSKGTDHTLTVTIPTWSDGAGQVSGSAGRWYVTATVDVVPGKAPRQVLGVVPLVNASIGSDYVFEPIDLDVPRGTRELGLAYRVTGHGGTADPDSGRDCLSVAEEFCKRRHSVWFDDTALEADWEAWRTDCFDACKTTISDPDGVVGIEFCATNPCGAVQSVRAPRANWCPGQQTPPREWVVARPKQGPHTARFAINRIAPGGSWRVSLVAIAYGDEK